MHIAYIKTDILYKYCLGYNPEELKFMNHSSLSKFCHLRLKDTNLLDVLISKIVDIALEAGIMDTKVNLIMDSTHTNAMFQHISPREALMKRAKAQRKTVCSIDSSMMEKCLRKDKVQDY